MTRRPRSTARVLMVRYAPLFAVAIVIALVIAVLGDGSNTARTRAIIGRAPVTFDEATARGTAGRIDWGPQCDTSLGRVAVPFWYAPPCVKPWHGNNGGATAPGVTSSEITVVSYESQPDLLQQSFFQQSGSDESLAAEFRTNQQYVDFFQSHYEMYGRKVHLIAFKATGAPDDDVAAKADAIKVATELHAFASFGGPGQTPAYAETLAAHGVLCLGDCVIAEPASFLRRNAPDVWPTLAAPEQAAEHWAAFVGRSLAGRKAIHAGDPKLRRRTRRFGIVHYDDSSGTFTRSFDHFAKLLRPYHVHIATAIPYQLDLAKAQESARTIIAELKDAHVTSVVLAGDPIFPGYLTREATAQGYFPEWVLMGYAYTDTAVFGRTYDQRQWAHAFGVSLLPTRQTDAVDEFASVVKWQSGREPIASTFRALMQSPLIFFTGVHLAGPDLTPATFRRGLFHFPAKRPTSAPFLHLSWGRHQVWHGVDWTAGDDAVVVWWDPNATGPDEVGNAGRGMYRYALHGRRYLPGEWPRNTGLYDVRRSVTILHSLPADAVPPSYPSPAAH